MAKKYLFGFDIGTSESKGTICDQDGNVIATAASAHSLKTPHPGWAEHDPLGDWWYDFKKITAELLEKSGVDPKDIAGIGVSAIMAAITPVDEKGNPLRNAILYGIDTRCQAQAKELNETIGEETLKEWFDTTLTIEHFGPKILWIKQNEPEVFAKTKQITMASGFVNLKLTGVNAVDIYSATSALPMYDMTTDTWDDARCAYVCPKEMLPKVCKTYDIIGEVTAGAAAETGLAAGTPVICGTTDAGAEAVSVGVVEPGDTMLMYGSTMFFIHVLKEMVKGAYGKYTIDGPYAFAGGMATTGSLTRWLRDTTAPDLLVQQEAGGENAYAALFAEAKDIPAGSDGLLCLPYFLGERMPIQDPNAKGMYFGLNLHHTRGHLVKAAFEGMGFGLDQNLAMLRSYGATIGTATAVGGGTKTPLWIQTVSDITGVRQQVPEVTVGASYGDALMAGLAVGLIESPKKIKEMIKIKYVTEPNPDTAAVYDKYRPIFKELYQRNKDLMHQLP